MNKLASKKPRITINMYVFWLQSVVRNTAYWKSKLQLNIFTAFNILKLHDKSKIKVTFK